MRGRAPANVLKRREEYFWNIETLSDTEAERLSESWHRLVNRYQALVQTIQYIRRAKQ